MIDRLLDPLVRRLLRPRSPDPRPLPADLADLATDVTIEAAAPMKGWLLHSGRAKGTVLIVHGWGSDGVRSSGLARSLLQRDLAVLLIDLPGHGRTGPIAAYGIPRMRDDLAAALRWLGERPGLLGISFGGVGAYVSAAREPGWAAVALLAAPMGPLEASSLYLRAKGVPRPAREILLRSAGRVLSLDGEDLRGATCLESVRVPVLIVHGTEDRVVPISHGHALASARQGGDREVRWISGAGHELADHPAAGSSVADFFSRTLAK